MDSLTEQIVKAFLSCSLPKEKWTHQAHLRVGLWHLLHYSPTESLKKLRHTIKQYNIACGIENTETQGYRKHTDKVGVTVSSLPLLSETVLVSFPTHGYSNVSTLS